MIQKKESMTVYSVLKRYRSRFVSNSTVKHTLSELIWKTLEFHAIGRDLKDLYKLVLMSKSRIEEAHKIFLHIISSLLWQCPGILLGRRKIFLPSADQKLKINLHYTTRKHKHVRCFHTYIFHSHISFLLSLSWVQSSLTEYSSSDDLSLLVSTTGHKASYPGSKVPCLLKIESTVITNAGFHHWSKLGWEVPRIVQGRKGQPQPLAQAQRGFTALTMWYLSWSILKWSHAVVTKESHLV